MWSVYLLHSPKAAATYVGITTDPERRLAQHNGELPGGAKATRAGRPWALERVWGPFETRGEAQRAEWQLKSRRGLADRAGWSPDSSE